MTEPQGTEHALHQAYQQLFSGQTEAAQDAFTKLQQAQPTCSGAWNGLGLLAEQKGHLPEALNLYQQALELNPHEPEYHNNLALLLQRTQQQGRALFHFHKTWELQPGPHSRQNLIQALLAARQQPEALRICRELLWQEPEHLPLHQMLFEQSTDPPGDLMHWYQHLARTHPRSATTCYFLACLHQQQGERAKACAYFERAYRLKPEWKLPRWQKLIEELKSNHLQAIDTARAFYTQQPDTESRLTLLNLLPPPVFTSATVQAATLHEMETLLHEIQTGTGVKAFHFFTPPFYLAYQNTDDRDWQTRLATLYKELIPHLDSPGGERLVDGKIRVGVISRFLYSHAVTFCFGALLKTLAEAPQIELYLFPITDQQRPPLAFGTETQTIPLSLTAPLLGTAEAIRQCDCNLLIYPEIGMDPLTYMLAYSRLAPIQIMLAGHPVTSGIPTIDYFVTSAELEIPDCQTHYSEQWVGLPGLIDYQRPAAPEPLSRAALGLPEDRNLYFCPMTLFKIHPDLDDCLAQILRQDPKGTVILFQYLRTDYHQILQTRFAQTMPDVSDRILFLPFQSFARFLSLLAQADVVLDSFYFGGGNTSFLAFGLGRPVVTLPSRYLKARSTLGLYRRMALTEGTAETPEDYVQKALALGQHQDWNQTISNMIQQRSDQIFTQTDWSQALLTWILTRFT